MNVRSAAPASAGREERQRHAGSDAPAARAQRGGRLEVRGVQRARARRRVKR